MDKHSQQSQFDSRLAALQPGTGADMEFPTLLVTSLRRRRIHRRIKMTLAAVVPIFLIAVAVSFWPRPVQLPAQTASTVIVRDPARLPAETNWQPVSLQRAGGTQRLNVLDF